MSTISNFAGLGGDFTAGGSMTIATPRTDPQGLANIAALNAAQAGASNTTAQLTAQQQENAKYRGQLDTYMTQDPSNGYDSQLKQLMSGTFNTSDPSYAWRFSQGQQAAERSAAASGLLDSGNAAIALQQYGQGAASQEFQAQYTRVLGALQQSETDYQAGYSRLAELAGMNTSEQGSAMSAGLGYYQAGNTAAYQSGLLNIEQQSVNQAGQAQSFSQNQTTQSNQAFAQLLQQYQGSLTQGTAGGAVNPAGLTTDQLSAGFTSGASSYGSDVYSYYSTPGSYNTGTVSGGSATDYSGGGYSFASSSDATPTLDNTAFLSMGG